MPLDGTFIHYLTNELNNYLKDSRINKITCPNQFDIVFHLRCKINDEFVSKDLFISSRLDSPCIYLTTKKFINPETPSNFCMILRKYLERGVIKEITQHHNDRIIELHISTRNEIDVEMNTILLIELMGRNSNIILLRDDNIIIDSIRKLVPTIDNTRIILPKAHYEYPHSDKLNPFLDTTPLDNINNLEGISKNLKEALKDLNTLEIKEFLHQKLNPVIYKSGNKEDFYSYPLGDNEIISYYQSLNELLDAYYVKEKNIESSLKIELTKIANKELKKNYHKLDNLNLDLAKAKNNLIYSDYGILLQSNYHLLKKGDSNVTVNNFLHDNEEITINLDPLLSPSDNLKKIFQIAKKANNSLIETNKQIDKTNSDIQYFKELTYQISISSNEELEEIKQELVELKLIKDKNKMKKNKTKTIINKLNVDGLDIYYGKNNIQNNHITHKLSSSNDYWFHVKDMPGSHVLIKVPNNDPNFILSEKIIRYAANLAAINSMAHNSSSVPVDYTKIKYIKKIPGEKGSHVTYTNQKTIYIDPIIE